jgi:hypothetical protein
MKTHRYISIFLTLCFSVFLGHNLIPHHHHSEQVSVPVATECPVDHGDTHEHHQNADHKSLHCHAFNDVVFDKYNSIQIGELNARILMLALRSVSCIPAPKHTEVFSSYIQFKIPDKPSEYFGARSLRGPPPAV